MRKPRLSSLLTSITLDDVLTGETCAPISLADFEAYLEYREHSVENLRFVVWYQSYRRRFFALPLNQQRLSPGSREFSFALPTPARTAHHVSRASTRTAIMVSEPSSPLSPTSPTSPTAPLTGRASLPSRSQVPAPAHTQPFRQECTLVESTFLLPSSPQQLSLPDLLLSTILRELSYNTHPDVFLAAYEHAYEALLVNSLPRFLKLNETNVNIEKTWYWWLQGIMSSLLGWIIVIGCLFISSGPQTSEARLRAWRLLGVPFLTLGAMQMYSGYRGYCSEVFGRGHVQLRPWEMSAPSLPTTASVSRQQSSQSSLYLKHGEKSNVAHVGAVEPVTNYESIALDTSALHTPPSSGTTNESPPGRPAHAISPTAAQYRDTWAFPPSASTSPNPSSYQAMSPPGSPRTEEKFGLQQKALTAFSVRTPRSGPYVELNLSARARVFGPERVVLDPRIRAVHRKVLRDMLVVGMIFGPVLTAVVLVLPHAR